MANFRRGVGFRLRRHLIACPACAARLEETRLLRDRIRAEMPRFAAPESLRASVMALAGEPSSRASSRSRPDYRWRWMAAGALAGSVLTMFILFASNAILDRRSNEDLASVAVTAHVRATLGNQLIQVASSDQHTVKPWLSARLDYSPPVRDLASDGFPLVGAESNISMAIRLPCSSTVIASTRRRLRTAGMRRIRRVRAANDSRLPCPAHGRTGHGLGRGFRCRSRGPGAADATARRG